MVHARPRVSAPAGMAGPENQNARTAQRGRGGVRPGTRGQGPRLLPRIAPHAGQMGRPAAGPGPVADRVHPRPGVRLDPAQRRWPVGARDPRPVRGRAAQERQVHAVGRHRRVHAGRRRGAGRAGGVRRIDRTPGRIRVPAHQTARREDARPERRDGRPSETHRAQAVRLLHGGHQLRRGRGARHEPALLHLRRTARVQDPGPGTHPGDRPRFARPTVGRAHHHARRRQDQHDLRSDPHVRGERRQRADRRPGLLRGHLGRRREGRPIQRGHADEREPRIRQEPHQRIFARRGQQSQKLAGRTRHLPAPAPGHPHQAEDPVPDPRLMGPQHGRTL